MAWSGAGRIARCVDARCTGSGRAPGRGPRHRWRPGSHRAFARRLVAHPVGDPEPEQGVLVRGIERQGAGVGIDRLVKPLGAAPDCQGVADRPPCAGGGVRLGLAEKRVRVGGTGRPRSTRRASSANVLSRNSAANVSGRGRTARTMPCSSIATTIGTAGASRRLIGSWRIGQSNRFHWANSRQRSACCSWVTPSSTRRPCFDPLASRFVPDWHVLAAAHSPGGELDEQHLLAAEVRQARRVCDRRSSAE